MKPEPLVSVIMNCFNGERFLRAAIDSLMVQTFPRWELIFWDNASTDRTAEIALSYGSDPRLKYHRASSNTPLGPARQLALEKATGEYLGFLDSDDLYLPRALEDLVALIQSGDFALAYGGAVIIDESGRKLGERKPKYSSGHLLGPLLEHYEISMVGALVRTSVLRDMKLGFNSQLSYSPDYDLFMRLAARHEVGVTGEFVAQNRRVRNSLSNKTLHLVSGEIGYTLDALNQGYPDEMRSCAPALAIARDKLHFYDAVSLINRGRYREAIAAVRPVVGKRWQYLALYLMLQCRLPRTMLLRIVGRA